MEYFLDFDLPENLIATSPAPERDGDRLMLINHNKLNHYMFTELPLFLNEGDVLVVNNSKVFKARLSIRLVRSDLESEMLLIEAENPYTWTAMLKKARRFKKGDLIIVANCVRAKVMEVLDSGLRRIRFEEPFSAERADQIGLVPLPPYIIEQRKKRSEVLYSFQDEERYQTLFAKYYGSVAAPTASLRFSQKILESLKNKGVQVAELTLHVGLGTFKPMDQLPENFKMHKEKISVPYETIQLCLQAKNKKKRVIAAGTTVCRALEASGNKAFCGETDIFIKPGYQFRMIDGLITNFHLPQSTLLLLVQAFAGIDNIRHAYAEAILQQYRFFSYGDGMLILQ
ncbi:S-adenosylmethionine:tRNA ribosyltransferase-isomerase [Brevinema andersonii]|uniref:S-adenosylmethionine:tRNA ribosyltransferase-isomerase n=1 Tax=Brevinema andersonii TaxID=34097 RepID=A0A1I1D992_BREAD|nr:tRNA preQ1(34) S-adenosylmethionine ribosyltransferase-isomerase QueA [Brevinema andersonii]SFB71511.1 S-adenosylmethionine:tRNA ribosyltransferase-isomerase [Brevinema andersonii]